VTSNVTIFLQISISLGIFCKSVEILSAYV